MQHRFLPRALPPCAVPGAPALVVVLAVTFAGPLYGDPGKPDPNRELAAARALAERWGGGVKDPERGRTLGVGLDSYDARRSVAVRMVWLRGPEVGDRELARLCDHLRHVPGALDLSLEKTSITDKGLESVARLTGLHTLKITNAGLTGEGLGRLAGLKDLAILDLARTKVTGEGLRQLTGPKHLKEFYLRETRVTDRGLAALGRLPELEYLDLSDTPVTNAGVARLKGLKELQFLFLSRTRIDGRALESLAGLRKMRLLFLDGTALTDAGLAPLSGLSQLRHLDLSGTRVGDAGLKHLSGLSHLEGLSLSKTGVTEAGLQHVAGLPHLVSISYDRPGGRFAWLAPAKIPFEKSDIWWGGPRSTRGGKVRLNVVQATPVFLLARLYDTEKKKEIGGPLYNDKLGWPRAEITCWAFSPDGKLVATGSGYREAGFGRDRTSVGQIRVWAVPTGKLVATYPHAVGYVKALAFSKDGKKVLFNAEEYDVDGP